MSKVKLKELKLKNYLGYHNVDLNFTHNGVPNQINLFYGPNGIGKSSFLQALNLLLPETSIRRLETHFNSITYAENANKTIQEAYGNADYSLLLKGLFLDDKNNEKVVLIENNEYKKTGISRTDFDEPICSFIDVDNPLKTRNFAFNLSFQGERFLEIMEIIYGYKVVFPNSTLENSNLGTAGRVIEEALDEWMQELEDENTGEEENPERNRLLQPIDPVVTREGYAQDLVIQKTYQNSPDVNVHYKNMSAGEKKIAALFKHLLATSATESHIFLIDNVDMHVYYTRHGNMIDKLVEYFPDR